MIISYSNVIAYGHLFIIKENIIDEDAIHRKIQENKKKPVKKSKFQERLEQKAIAQQQKARQK